MGSTDPYALAELSSTCTLRREEWTHTAYLIVGLWHVRRCGAQECLVRHRIGIQRLNECHGTANSATGGYHETITRADVHVLSEFLASCPREMSLEESVVLLVRSRLANKDVLLDFCSRDRLMSVSARAEWCEPDLAPLRVATTGFPS